MAIRRALFPLTLLAAVWLAVVPSARQPDYRGSIEAWRANYERQLRADDGWLTVVGLAWLEPGDNAAGSADGSPVRLPAAAPAKLGLFRLDAGRVTFAPEPGAGVAVNGRPVAGPVQVRTDADGHYDRVTSGSLTLFVIKRGDRFGVRIKDSNSEARRTFEGTRWYPVHDAWRVAARFVPYPATKAIRILNVLGQVENQPCPGYVAFTIDGHEYRLDPIAQNGSAGRLFFIFKDATAGTTTYPAGRFLYADTPKAGRVDLDFNKAESPPCAFTPFATCPLPPKQNELPIRIEAGEQYVHR